MRKIDLVGKKFGRLIVLKQGPHSECGRFIRWYCRCDCGKRTLVYGGSLKCGNTNSCGCLGAQSRGQSQRTHGEGYNETKEYKSWQSAKGRCYNPNNPKFPFYGGRGIRMSKAWLRDYSAFLRDMGRAPKGTSIDRIDNNGNYEHGNCRWATPAQQSNNQSRNIIVNLPDGRVLTLAQFFQELGLSYPNAYQKYRRHGIEIFLR